MPKHKQIEHLLHIIAICIADINMSTKLHRYAIYAKYMMDIYGGCMYNICITHEDNDINHVTVSAVCI